MSIAILTDNGAAFTKKELSEYNVSIISLKYLLDNVEYIEEVDENENDFFDKLRTAKTISTSQPSISELYDILDELLKKYDEVLYMPISSGLSGSYSNGLSVENEDKYKNKVFTVDHKKISVVQKYAVFDALRLIDKGLSAKEIRDILEKYDRNFSIYIMVDTLEYLKRGGRVNPLVAKVGDLLQIKPIMYTDGGPFDIAKKDRTDKKAKDSIIGLIKKDMEFKFNKKDPKAFSIGVAYTKNKESALDMKGRILSEIGEFSRDILVDKLADFVACHIGPNAIGVALYRNIDEC